MVLGVWGHTCQRPIYPVIFFSQDKQNITSDVVILFRADPRALAFHDVQPQIDSAVS